MRKQLEYKKVGMYVAKTEQKDTLKEKKNMKESSRKENAEKK